MVHHDLLARMNEATRLTVAGRLTEATALIQAALQGLPASGAAHPGRETEAGDASELVREPGHRPASQPHQDSATRLAALLRRLVGTRHGAPRPAVTRRPPSCFLAGAGTAVMPGRPVPTTRSGRDRSGPAPAAPDARAGLGSGRFLSRTYSNAAGSRDYKLYVPSGSTGQPLPLVVMLHGGTQTADDFAAGTRMNAFAERDTFLVAYPEQPASANGAKCWNWFEPLHQRRDTGEPSLIAGITRQVMSEHPVDPARVHVVGFSAGGAMAAVMAATYPELFAAVGVHSGLGYGAAHNLPSALMAMRGAAARPPGGPSVAAPLIVFHGDQDRIVHPVNAQRLVQDWAGIPQEAAAPAAAPVIERGEVGGGTFTRFLYPGHGGRPEAELWLLHQTGHAWSGGSSDGSYADPQGPDASAEMLRFFGWHSKAAASPAPTP